MQTAEMEPPPPSQCGVLSTPFETTNTESNFLTPSISRLLLLPAGHFNMEIEARDEDIWPGGHRPSDLLPFPKKE